MPLFPPGLIDSCCKGIQHLSNPSSQQTLLPLVLDTVPAEKCHLTIMKQEPWRGKISSPLEVTGDRRDFHPPKEISQSSNSHFLRKCSSRYIFGRYSLDIRGPQDVQGRLKTSYSFYTSPLPSAGCPAGNSATAMSGWVIQALHRSATW